MPDRRSTDVQSDGNHEMPSVPRISFGLPVRNGGARIAGTIESVLSQDFEPLELVISDNASTDETRGICEGFAARDGRVHYHRNALDIGRVGNFNRVFELARAPYFRWIGCDDTISPSYASKCMASLDAAPHAVGVTTLWEFVDADGMRYRSELRGERLASVDPLQRLSRFLWYMEADRLLFDPIYSLLRRDVLARTQLLLSTSDEDRLLALEIALQGPFAHLDEFLASRSLPMNGPEDIVPGRRQPSLAGTKYRTARRYWMFGTLWGRSDHSRARKLVGWGLIGGHFIKRLVHEAAMAIRRAVARVAKQYGLAERGI